jgi:hypothetical protein
MMDEFCARALGNLRLLNRLTNSENLSGLLEFGYVALRFASRSIK